MAICYGFAPFLLLISSNLIYAVINAALVALLFSGIFRINRVKVFFTQAFIRTFISALIIIAAEIFFIQMLCMISGGCPPEWPGYLLLTPALYPIALFVISSLIIQRVMMRDEFALSDTVLFMVLIVSNAGAALAKYATLVWLG